jgi:hypothetical protein
MNSSLLFHKQSDQRHLLQSLLIALNFTSALESKYAQNAVKGFVYNKHFYINNQQIRGWLKKQGDLLYLSEKAKRLVQESDIDLITNKTGGDIKISHEALLVRSLFLCLLHLDFSDIVQIKKQKYYEGRYIPDLTIITRTDTIFIEVDTGKQPLKTLESKIRGLQVTNSEATLIYFTSSDKHYSHFSQNRAVQFIYLDSPTLAEDILQLFSTNRINNTINSTQYLSPKGLSEPNSNSTSHSTTTSNTTANPFFYPTSKATFKLAHNVFVYDKTLVYDPALVAIMPDHEPVGQDTPTLDLELMQAKVIKLMSEND